MEHSLLHGLQLCGLILALGGVLFRWLVLTPASRNLSSDVRPAVAALHNQIGGWIVRAALAAALGAGIDFFVQVAEIDGQTIYGGVQLSQVVRYLLGTTVGNLALAKGFLLVVTALLARLRLPDLVLFVLLVAASVLSTLVSHSAALPVNRGPAIISQSIHIIGAAFWLGMLAFVLLSAACLQSSGTSGLQLLSRIVDRYSPFALVSAILIGLSGLYSSARFIFSLRAIPISAYGLTLALKLVLAGAVTYAGFLNWRQIGPRLTDSRESQRAVSDFLRVLEFELTTGILLLLVAGILGAISPPAEIGTAQLSSAQVQALLDPRLPQGHFADPQTFVGAASRTDDDLRYAEFTHQWAGVFVLVLGLCWLGQATSRRFGPAFARTWPLVLIPFGGLISAIADPEVWILRTISIREVFSNPQILEHQIGAALVFVFAFLGLRDRKRWAELRPLGYAFPILVIAGSLMLLGHAHSNLGVSEELSSLINMEHAVIGGLGLLAGTARWLQIRGLAGKAAFRWLWPGLIVALGVFMAFFYRELTPLSQSALAFQ